MADTYAFIMAGGGLSGLTLAYELCRQPAFEGRKILIVDREKKVQNDRTWCFWATEAEILPPVVHKTWSHAWFFGENITRSMSLAPYQYGMVRSADYYHWITDQLQKYAQVSFLHTNIHDIDPRRGVVRTGSGDFHGDWILNSALSAFPLLPDGHLLFPQVPFSVSGQGQKEKYENFSARYPNRTFMLQHFKGWYIETEEDVFHPQEMTLMDYRIEQKGETRFVYVLPLSEKSALIEFTIFSEKLAPPEEYERVLSQYIPQYVTEKKYRIVEKEAGIIPMTDFPFGPLREGRMIRIGTAGGFVKASSGYAFLRTLRRLRAFAANWADNDVPDERLLRSHRRFQLYDRIVLRVLHNGELSGKSVFSTMFQKIPVADIFCYLDEDTRLPVEWRIANVFPKLPFLKASFQLI